MRIALIIDGLTWGGSEKQAVSLAIAMSNLGHEVSLVTWTAQNDFADELAASQVRLIRLDSQGRRLHRLITLRRKLREIRPEVVHCIKGTPSVIGSVAARLARVPKVYGGLRDCARLSGLTRTTLRIVNTGLTGWIVNAKAIKPIVIEDFGSASRNVHIVPNIVHTERYQCSMSKTEARKRFDLEPDAFVVTLIANFQEKKNFPMFLRVAQRVSGREPRAQFVSAGGSDTERLPNKVRELAAEMGLETVVRFLGPCRAVPELLAATDVVILTSDIEGMPNCLLEASAAGVPCVTTNYGSPAEIVEHAKTGFIVPVNDDQAMADHVLSLAADDSLRRELGQAGRRRIEIEFSTAAVVERLLQVYRGEATAC